MCQVAGGGKQDAVHTNGFGALNVGWTVVQKESILGRDPQAAQAMLIDLRRWLGNTQFAGKRPLIEFRQPIAGKYGVAHGEGHVRKERDTESGFSKLTRPTRHRLVGMRPAYAVESVELFDLRGRNRPEIL